jgi:GNAT superfamily N-acetyltransferase
MTIGHLLRIEHVEGTDWWEGFVGEDRVTTFEYVQDEEGRTWLASATTLPAWQRRGIGRLMIAEAVAYYDEVWASRAARSDGPDSDTRYLSQEGAALVESCIRAGIMKPAWLRNPYFDPPDADLKRE